jgi:hypothetical protein
MLKQRRFDEKGHYLSNIAIEDDNTESKVSI